MGVLTAVGVSARLSAVYINGDEVKRCVGVSHQRAGKGYTQGVEALGKLDT